jgi:hypothetical protein
MASAAPWSDDELQVLEDFAECRNWIDAALAELPGRTKAAARSMMQKVRIRLGACSSPKIHEGSWMVNAINGSRQLLEALERSGLRP